MKIAVLGDSGSGKSTLACALGEWFDAPVLHLDSVQFCAGWAIRDRDEALETVRTWMQRPAWIIDGNYAAFDQEARLADADQIVLMEFPRLRCLMRAYRRYRRYRGTTRADVAPECPEKFDLEFAWWILYRGRRRSARTHYRAIALRYPEKTVCLHSQRQTDRFLASLHIAEE